MILSLNLRLPLAILLASLSGCPGPTGSPPPAGKAGEPAEPAALVIRYKFAGLTELALEGRHLRYVWHTLKDEDLPRQSLAAYDRREIGRELTIEEAARFRRWVETHRIFDLPRGFPRGDRGSYAAAFKSSLNVECGGRSYRTGWNGATLTPDELGRAIVELKRLGDEFAAAAKPAAPPPKEGGKGP